MMIYSRKNPIFIKGAELLGTSPEIGTTVVACGMNFWGCLKLQYGHTTLDNGVKD